MRVTKRKKEKNEKKFMRRISWFLHGFLRSLTNGPAVTGTLFSSEPEIAWHNIRLVAPAIPNSAPIDASGGTRSAGYLHGICERWWQWIDVGVDGNQGPAVGVNVSSYRL